MAYSQTNPEWADKELGNSGLNCKNFGCTVTCAAEALTLAGYPVTPGELIDGLNGNGGFTDQGLLIWGKVSELYPQFHFGNGNYEFVQGLWGKFQHWVLKYNGVTYDPYYGVENEPAGFKETGLIRYAVIDLPPTPEPTPEPAPAPSEWPKTITVTVPELFVRTEATSTSAPAISEHCPHGYLVNGDQFQAVAVVRGEDPYGNGNDKWLQSDFGHFAYSGGTDFIS